VRTCAANTTSTALGLARASSMSREQDDDQAVRLISIVLVPLGIVVVIFWILVFYTLIVLILHLNWPTPLDWLPFDFLPRRFRQRRPTSDAFLLSQMRIALSIVTWRLRSADRRACDPAPDLVLLRATVPPLRESNKFGLATRERINKLLQPPRVGKCLESSNGK
jgi:hypothetical protein